MIFQPTDVIDVETYEGILSILVSAISALSERLLYTGTAAVGRSQ